MGQLRKASTSRMNELLSAILLCLLNDSIRWRYNFYLRSTRVATRPIVPVSFPSRQQEISNYPYLDIDCLQLSVSVLSITDPPSRLTSTLPKLFSSSDRQRVSVKRSYGAIHNKLVVMACSLSWPCLFLLKKSICGSFWLTQTRQPSLVALIARTMLKLVKEALSTWMSSLAIVSRSKLVKSNSPLVVICCFQIATLDSSSIISQIQ